jgi:hypothetical protein
MLVALAMMVIALPAQAGCPVPPGAVEVALPSGLPVALRDKMGDVALPGQPFNAIDTYVKGQPNRRYIFVWNIDSRWIVAMEIGGIALRSAVFVYDLANDGKTARRIGERTGTKNVCRAATELAAGNIRSDSGKLRGSKPKPLRHRAIADSLITGPEMLWNFSSRTGR